MPSALPTSAVSLEWLSDIRKTALDITHRCAEQGSTRIHRKNNPLTLPPPRYEVPRASSIVVQLMRSGASEELATLLSDSYMRNASEWCQQTQDLLNRVWDDWTHVPFTDEHRLHLQYKNLAKAYIVTCKKQLNTWQAAAMDMVTSRLISRSDKHLAVPGEVSKKDSNPFNHEYTPLLEKYFEHNAYPSAADRAVLARKSMMTDRQIEVWFQNHRNRAKKERKDLPRLRTSDPLPLKLSLESLEQQMGGFIVPESERVDTVDSDVSEYEIYYDSDEEDASVVMPRYLRNPHALDAFNVAAPPHAFPIHYPPSCDYDPFPVKHGKFTFPAPLWMRKPATSLVQRSAIDIDDFCDDFGKLSVREGPRRHSRKRIPSPGLPVKPRRTSTPPPKPDRSAATRAITTIPPPAPHPAFLRTSIPLRVTPPPPVPILPAVPASCSRMHAFHSPSPQSPPATLMPPTQLASVVKKSAGRRKVAPLPKRTPNNTASVAHRGVSPATSDVSSSPSNSHPPHSRTSSFGSDSSSRTRMSSSSSSSASSTLTTPLSSTTSLPETLHSPSQSVAISDFNFNAQNFADIFGSSSIRSLSPIEGLQLDFPSSATFGDASVAKQPFDFNFGTPSTTSFVRAQS